MPKEKACKICQRIFEGEKCPNCDSKEFTETIKGRIFILNPEKSELAKELNIKGKGEFAIKAK